MWLSIVTWILFVFFCACILSTLPVFKRHPQKETHSPSELGLAFETVQLFTRDKISLTGWWIPVSGSHQAIIMLHGYAGSMDPDLKYAPHLHAAGFNVLMFDFRAHGRSSGKMCTLGARERADVVAAADFVKSKECTWIGLLGFSMGGRAAILSAPLISGVGAMISDGGPPLLTTVITNDLKRKKIPLLIAFVYSRVMLLGGPILSGVNLFRIEPLYQAWQLHGIPSLFINGEQDLYTQKWEIEKVVKDAGPQAELWSVPEAKHRNIEDTRPEEYIQKVLTFFKAHRATPILKEV
jgi:pimeloyl-ACP methyl ester carboxylesterase